MVTDKQNLSIIHCQNEVIRGTGDCGANTSYSAVDSIIMHMFLYCLHALIPPSVRSVAVNVRNKNY